MRSSGTEGVTNAPIYLKLFCSIDDRLFLSRVRASGCRTSQLNWWIDQTGWTSMRAYLWVSERVNVCTSVCDVYVRNSTAPIQAQTGRVVNQKRYRTWFRHGIHSLKRSFTHTLHAHFLHRMSQFIYTRIIVLLKFFFSCFIWFQLCVFSFFISIILFFFFCICFDCWLQFSLIFSYN